MTPTLGQRIGNGRGAEVFDYGDGQVLKLRREPGDTPWVAREAAAQEAVRNAGVPAPKVLGFAEHEGRHGIIMERIDGLDGLTAAERKPWRVWAIGRLTGRLHRQLAEVAAPPELPTLHEIARHDFGSPFVPQAARARLLAQLETAPNGSSICHMDFHPGNIMETDGGPFLIDFANARSGDPVADHVKSRLLLQVGDPAEVSPWQRVLITAGRKLMAAAYRSGYGPVDRRTMTKWKPIIVAQRLTEGIPEERKQLLRMLSRSLREAELP